MHFASWQAPGGDTPLPDGRENEHVAPWLCPAAPMSGLRADALHIVAERPSGTPLRLGQFGVRPPAKPWRARLSAHLVPGNHRRSLALLALLCCVERSIVARALDSAARLRRQGGMNQAGAKPRAKQARCIRTHTYPDGTSLRLTLTTCSGKWVARPSSDELCRLTVTADLDSDQRLQGGGTRV